MIEQNTPLNKMPSPFQCSSASNFAELLWKLQTSIAITTYQAGKTIFISPLNEDKVIQLSRSFPNAMGIGIDNNDKMVLATKDEVIVFTNSESLALHYPEKQSIYDSLYLPRLVYHTGAVDMHDVHIINDTIYGVNTRFSCIVKLTSSFNFEPIWSPSFISEIAPEDRCHLNGLAIINNEPAYCTALGVSNTPRGWKENVNSGGVLIDVKQNKVVLENLGMPHSPIWYKDKLYFAQSATGIITAYDPIKKTSEDIFNANKFVRGISILDDYMFIGLSKIRPSSQSFNNLEVSNNSNKAGILVIHIPTKSLFSWLSYEASVDEIYDIQVLPGKIRPNILNTLTEKHKMAFSMPGKSYWGVANETS